VTRLESFSKDKEMQQLLAALDNPRPNGKDKYRSRCPVHGGNNPTSLSVRLNQDGSVSANCFSCGANGLDLYKTLGLDLDELFGGKKGDFIPQSIKDQLSVDRMFIAIYESDVERGVKPKLTEKKRYRLALARSEGIKNKFNIV